MSLRVMYAHLGLLEPGTAAVDRDGDVWCVWPSGHGGLHNPNISPDLLQATAIWGPFAVIGEGLPSTICDACGRAAQDGNPTQAKSVVLEYLGKPQPEGPLWAELGVESIDGPNGLRTLMGARAIAVGVRVRLRSPGCAGGKIAEGPDDHGCWRVVLDRVAGNGVWCDSDELEVAE